MWTRLDCVKNIAMIVKTALDFLGPQRHQKKVIKKITSNHFGFTYLSFSKSIVKKGNCLLFEASMSQFIEDCPDDNWLSGPNDCNASKPTLGGFVNNAKECNYALRKHKSFLYLSTK